MSLSGHYISDEHTLRQKLAVMLGSHEQENHSLKSSLSEKQELLIIMDTSALMETPCSEMFIRKIQPALARRGEKIVIPISVMGELRNIARSKSGSARSIKAGKVFRSVMDFWRHGVIRIYDNHGAGGIFADEQFQVLAIGFSRSYRVIVISQDYLLGQDLLTISRLPSVKGRRISVRKLNHDGTLSKVTWNGASYLSENPEDDRRQ